MREIREAFGQRIKTDHTQSYRRQVKTDFVDEITGDDETKAAQQTKHPRARQRNLSGRQMSARRPGIRFVERAVNDPVERHRAGPGTNQRGENQAEGSPARPAALVARGDRHGGQREGQREDGVGKFDEGSPFVNEAKHRTANIEHRTSNNQSGSPDG